MRKNLNFPLDYNPIHLTAAYVISCVSLQAVNLAGLVRITEEALLFLASRCQGLLMLNLTGCERVTVVGLDHLIRGLHFVENAVSFMGFRPVDEHGNKICF